MTDFDSGTWGWLEEEEDEGLITFHNEDVEDFSLPDEAEMAQWLQAIIDREGKDLQQLAYIFCSDEYLYNINLEYLQHDTYTDVITFPYAEPPTIEGDIFISVERVRENAQSLEVPFEQELRRVMAHGLLHLCGYSDKTAEDAASMRLKEDEALDAFPN
jgi:rRNA maturation RNase YbeY